MKSNQEILEKAIRKAVANGWAPFDFGTPMEVTSWDGDGMITIAVVFPLHEDSTAWVRELEGIIFNHDFAKALWGEELGEFINPTFIIHKDGTSENGHTDKYYGPWYKYHLMQMVIADDPIQYLGSYI